ncbi:MAG: diguanylate cyclase [Hyphomicrobiaceae bacterium]
MQQSVSQLSDRYGPALIAFGLGLATAQVLPDVGHVADSTIVLPPLAAWLETAFQSARVWISEHSLSGRALAVSAGAIVVACLVAIIVHGRRSGLAEDKQPDEPSEAMLFQKSVLQVEDELAEIMASIKTYLSANNRFSRSLQQAASDLTSKTSARQVADIVQALIAENQQFRKDTRRLNDDLTLSRDEIQQLTADLSQAQRDGLRDALTSVGNRRLFDLVLSEEMVKAQDRNTAMALVMADIDHFKRVNDEFGHLVGDEVLKRFADLLKRNVKGRDTVARYGGEEFTLILPSTDQSDAFKLVEQIRSQLKQTQFSITETGEKMREITASFGVTAYHPGEEKSQLIKRADQNLYEAKRCGRNRSVCA